MLSPHTGLGLEDEKTGIGLGLGLDGNGLGLETLCLGLVSYGLVVSFIAMYLFHAGVLKV